MRLIILMTLLLTTQLMHAQEQYLIVGTYTQKNSEGIYIYKFNPKTGNLKKIGVTKGENPSYLAIAGDKKHVYAVLENGTGRGMVAAYSFNNENGNLKLLNSQSSNGDAPCYVSIDKTNKWVVTANYTGGNFCVYPVKNDGTLGEAVQNIQHVGSSVNKERQEKAHAHAAVFSPDQKFLAVTDLGTDKIMVYPFDAKKEKPVTEKATEVPTRPGAGPRHIVFHPKRPFAYIIEELSGYVTAYRYKDGQFTFLQTINAHPGDFKGTIGSAAIKISPDGKFLCASNRGTANSIATFVIEPSIGKLRIKGFRQTGGDGPRDISFDPSGNYLLSTNSNSNTVAVFRRNRVTGLPEEAGKQISVPEPVCLVFVR